MYFVLSLPRNCYFKILSKFLIPVIFQKKPHLFIKQVFSEQVERIKYDGVTFYDVMSNAFALFGVRSGINILNGIG